MIFEAFSWLASVPSEASALAMQVLVRQGEAASVASFGALAQPEKIYTKAQ